MGHTSNSVEVFLDGRTLAVPKPTLAEALRLAASEAQSRGRVIIEVKADGERIPDSMLVEPSAELTGVRVLSFTSANPRELVAQTLRDAVAALDETSQDHLTASDYLQTGRTQEAIEVMGRVITSWQAVGGVVEQSAALLGLRLGELTLEGVEPDQGFTAATSELRTHLRAMKDAMEQEDWSALSDVLAYDLEAQAGRWRVLVGALADLVERGNAGAGG